MSWSDVLKAPSGHSGQGNADLFDSDNFYLDTSRIPQLLSNFVKPTKGSPTFEEDSSTLDTLTKYAWTGTFTVILQT